MPRKIVIYQVLPRLFGNVGIQKRKKQIPGGTIQENGVGKLWHFNRKALQEIKKLGATHVWYTGVLEHATCTDYSAFGIRPDAPEIVKGRAGSPYAIKDYYDIDPDLAINVARRMEEFEELVTRTHNAGLKAIIDFVPNHVARAYYSDAKPAGAVDFGANDDTAAAFSNQNNFYYLPDDFTIPQGVQPFGERYPAPAFTYREQPAKVTGNDCFSPHPSASDWYETVKLNYGVDYQHGRTSHFQPVPDTWSKMRDILLFWTKKEVDGFRCDMAGMVPVAFWNWAIPQIKAVNPEIIFIAEIYQSEQYRSYIFEGHFDYLYDKVGLYDTLRNVIAGGTSTAAITACWQQAEGIGERMLRFMENHDEQRIASRFFAGSEPHKALPAMLVSAALHRGPVMMYCGQEVGEPAEGAVGFSGDDGRTSIFDYTLMPEWRKWVNNFEFDGKYLSEEQKKLRENYSALLRAVAVSDAVANGEFYDLMWANGGQTDIDFNKVYVFLRHSEKEKMLCVAYFGAQRGTLHVQIPGHAFQTMKLNESQTYKAENIVKKNDEQMMVDGKMLVPLNAYDYKMYKLTPRT